ncbi:hypothetical protein PMAYCL1PPCAC_13125 [Pristionchus mayeri]|uniref:Uncharacterized protein n=1 Tax=Pristionchus mayeri TaxID=1317129 RepID=A0AAN4ZTI8_9BILA|nr:hypothetical protein PMAYCL1PPCAC_13125 [Pristionchus mayeri]
MKGEQHESKDQRSEISPVDGFLAVVLEMVVHLAEALAPHEVTSGERRRMSCLDNRVLLAIYQRLLLVCESAPQQEDHALLLLAHNRYYLIRERVPSKLRMRVRFVSSYCEGGVEHEDALVSPALEETVVRRLESLHIRRQFLVNVLEGGRWFHSSLH